MKKSKKALSIFITITLMLNLCACWDRREFNEMTVVMGFAIDKAPAPDEISLTAQVARIKQLNEPEKSKGPGSTPYLNLTDSGQSIFAIIREFTHETSRKLYIGHNQVIIFGEDMAMQGIRENLDLLSRDHETRMTVYLFVAKGRAADILSIEPRVAKIPAVKIANMMENQKSNSEAAPLTLEDVVKGLSSTTKSLVAPYLVVDKDGEEEAVAIDGSVVFKDDKAVGMLNRKQTRGYMWVADKVKSGVIEVNVLDETATLEIKKASGKFTPKINKDGSISVKIKIEDESNLGSQTGTNPLNKVKNIKALEQAGAAVIKDEIEKTLQISREMGTDIYGFGDSVKRKYPQEFKELEDNWDKLYKNIKVDVEVKVKVRGGGRIVCPMYPENELIK